MVSDVGVRFTPTDDEIIDHLKKKRLDPDYSVDAVREIDLYKFEPWELPGLQSKEKVRYFFCKPKYMDRKKSERQHRKTKKGCWKSNGQGSKMKADNSREVIGTKRTLSFRRHGVSNKGNTEWVCHEISVKDDRLYKKDFVVCRVERKGNTMLGISTSAEEQSSQDLASGLSTDIFSDQLMTSERNHVAENIFSKTYNLISPSGNQVPGNTSLESVLPPNQQLVSYGNHVAENTPLEFLLAPNQHLVAENTSQLESILPANQYLVSDRNHVAENTYAESQLLHAFDSRLLARQHMASYSRNYVAEIASPESQQLANQNLLSWNTPLESMQAPNQHLVAENTSQLESMLLPSHSLASYPRNYTAFDSQLQASQHMASSSGNYVAEIASPESQQLANHNLLSWNTPQESMQAPNQHLVAENTSQQEFILPVNQYLVSNRNHVAENNLAESQLLPSHSIVSYSRNYTAFDTQLLENHNLFSYYRNHVPEFFSTELQPVPDENLESLILPNQYSVPYSTNIVEYSVEAEPRLLAEFNPHGGYYGLNNTSFSALQSPIYPEQELSYFNNSSYGCDLLNSPFYSERA